MLVFLQAAIHYGPKLIPCPTSVFSLSCPLILILDILPARRIRLVASWFPIPMVQASAFTFSNHPLPFPSLFPTSLLLFCSLPSIKPLAMFMIQLSSLLLVCLVAGLIYFSIFSAKVHIASGYIYCLLLPSNCLQPQFMQWNFFVILFCTATSYSRIFALHHDKQWKKCK